MASIFKKIILAGSTLFLLVASYSVIISFSEDRKYSKHTLDFFLLTPALIKNQPLSGIYSETYHYSAADGNKPVINSVTFLSGKKQEELHLIITKYLESLGYISNKEEIYTKENKEVLIEYERSGKEEISVKLSLMEYIE